MEMPRLFFKECDIVSSLWQHRAVHKRTHIEVASYMEDIGQNYNQFFKTIMQDKVIRFNKPTIVIAHTQDFVDDATLETKTYVPVKGALKNSGCEAFFSTIVSTKKIPVKDLKDYQNNMLNITEEDELLGFKYVFQTKLTRKTLGERIRSPMGMFKTNETFIDNDAQLLLDHLKEFYSN